MAQITVPSWQHVVGLSVRYPWSELLALGVKTVEVRAWHPRIELPQWVAIHETKQADRLVPRFVQARLTGLVHAGQSRLCRANGRMAGGFIGVALLDRIFDLTQEAWDRLLANHLNPRHWWGEGLTGLVFSHAVAFGEAIPYRGSLGLFPIDAETERRVIEATA